MKKKVFRERRKAEEVVLVNKGINFKVDDIEEVKPKKKRASKKKEA